ncbi:hypothetical protein ABIB25_005942, partial [Nakamurella sp. UYEF19]
MTPTSGFGNPTTQSAPPPHTGLLTVRARHAAGDVTPKPGLFRSLLG